MTDLTGQILANRYRVDEFIGRGGMAEVYKVWDTNRMTCLAMKLLHEDLAVDRVFMRRFQREAQTLAKLQHPNIVRFYGLEQDGPYAFMLLDFIEGRNLKRTIFDAGGPLPLDQVHKVMRSICTALQFTHREGLTHCDIKPGNIMIDHRGDVLLADFGIARMTDAATATMVGMGTPAYMAPEQIRGQDPTPQTDIYSLGIVLFEMLTGGERPFTGENARTTGSTSEKVRWEQVHMQPPSPRKWNPNISFELEAVVLKCVAKLPGDRFSSVFELLNSLVSALGDAGLEVGEPKLSFDDSQKIPVSLQREKLPVVSDEKPGAYTKPMESSRRNLVPWFVTGGFGIIALLAWIITSINSPSSLEVAQTAVSLNQTQTALVVASVPSITHPVEPTSTHQISTPTAVPVTPTKESIALSTEVPASILNGRAVSIAVENAYLPFNFIDPDTGEPSGWDYEVWDEICRIIGCIPIYVETSWEGLIQAVADEQFDVAADGITITEERDEIVDFSIGYIALEQRLLVRKSEIRFDSINDILKNPNLKLGVQIGTTNYAVAERFLPENQIQGFDTFSMAVHALISGSIDVIIRDEIAGQGYVGEGSGVVKFIGENLSTDWLGFIFPQGSDLVEPVNIALSEMDANGFLGSVNTKYFGPGFTITYNDLFPPETGDDDMSKVGECEPALNGPLTGVDPRGQTVVWWHNHQNDDRVEFLDHYIVEFNATNNCGITVEHQYQGSYNNIRDKMNTAISTGNLPGLVVGYQNDQAFYALYGDLVDMNLYIDDPVWGLGDEKPDFYASFLEQSIHPVYGGSRLGFPPNRSMLVMYYNQSWLNELGFSGPPRTPDEMKTMACAAAKSNGDGTGGLIIDTGASALAGWIFAFGGDILSDDGTGYKYNSSGAVAAMEFLKDMYDDGCAYIFSEGYPNPEFAARKAIFTTGSSSGIPYYHNDVMNVANSKNQDPDVWSITALPHTTSDPVQNVYGADVMIPTTSPETQLAAWIFIKYYTSPVVQADWVRASSYFPTRVSTSNLLEEYMSENQVWAAAVELLPFGYYEPQLISYQGVRDAASQAFIAVIQGANIQQTLDNLTTKANDLQDELSK